MSNNTWELSSFILCLMICIMTWWVIINLRAMLFLSIVWLLLLPVFVDMFIILFPYWFLNHDVGHGLIHGNMIVESKLIPYFCLLLFHSITFLLDPYYCSDSYYFGSLCFSIEMSTSYCDNVALILYYSSLFKQGTRRNCKLSNTLLKRFGKVCHGQRGLVKHIGREFLCCIPFWSFTLFLP